MIRERAHNHLMPIACQEPHESRHRRHIYSVPESRHRCARCLSISIYIVSRVFCVCIMCPILCVGCIKIYIRWSTKISALLRAHHNDDDVHHFLSIVCACVCVFAHVGKPWTDRQATAVGDANLRARDHLCDYADWLFRCHLWCACMYKCTIFVCSELFSYLYNYTMRSYLLYVLYCAYDEEVTYFGCIWAHNESVWLRSHVPTMLLHGLCTRSAKMLKYLRTMAKYTRFKEKCSDSNHAKKKGLFYHLSWMCRSVVMLQNHFAIKCVVFVYRLRPIETNVYNSQR